MLITGGEMMIDRAIDLFDVKKDELREFDVLDTFNGNQLSGFLCRRSDHRYGAMVIYYINGDPCEQVVWATPKQHYPFDKNGKFNWPQITEMQAWEKLDGTNILAYHYEYNGMNFVTYKTRLTPVVKDMGFGHFESMWRELLERENWIREVISSNPEYNLSFELYGQRNLITIQYKSLLDTTLLFGVRRTDHAIKPPHLLSVPTGALPKHHVVSDGDLTEVYNAFREEMSTQNENELLVEGIVLYAHVGEPSWRQFKCKPEQIEKIHWSHAGISSHSVWTTTVNAYEIKDLPTIDDVVELLKEEFSETQIGKSITKIHRIHREVYYHMVFVGEVNTAWEIAIKKGFDVTKDKTETMRFLSHFFNKKEMRRVGSIVLKQAGLL